MDEIEFRAAYNEAVTAAGKQPSIELHRALMLILQMLNSHEERIGELQEQGEDC
jgi:hypothetical protein